MSDSPCYLCEKRTGGCHSKCQEYIRWKNAQAEENNKLYLYKLDNATFTKEEKRRIERVKKRKGKTK